MGMFDDFVNELFCPYCGKKQKPHDFQTKDFKNCLDNLNILKIRGINYNLYHQCNDCNNWIDLNVDTDYQDKGGIHTLEEGKKQILKRQKHLEKMFKNIRGRKNVEN
jgi:sarcosine oxidase delta subunit